MIDHPSPTEMATYIDGTATPDEAGAIEAHLAECAECREELVVVRGSLRRPSPGTRWLAGAAATAAAIALLLFAPAWFEGDPSPIFRDASDSVVAGSVAAIETTMPGRSEVVRADEVRFVWRSVGTDAQYTFTLTTAAGDPITSLATADTSVVTLPGVELAPDTEYYWWVDALSRSGDVAETGLRRFRTAP